MTVGNQELDASSGSREPDPQAVPALSGFDPARFDTAEEALAALLRTPYPPVVDADDTLGTMVDNQAWVLLSHVASFIGHRDGSPDLMEEWQDAWARGEIQKGFLSPHRGVAAWIARHCELIQNEPEKGTRDRKPAKGEEQRQWRL